jgi:hypothetical protein
MNCNSVIGLKYERLTVTSEPISKKVGIQYYKIVSVVCDCGTIKEYDLSLLRRGKIQSCGCLRNEKSSQRMKNRKIHGLSEHPLNAIWRSMNNRCYNPNDISYCRYGAKGVTICDEWRTNFLSFYNWAIANGWEKGLQIDKDKIGTGKLYSPDTCIVLTRTENCWLRKSSRMIDYHGESKSLAEWCNILNLKYDNVRARIQRGIPTHIAFNN